MEAYDVEKSVAESEATFQGIVELVKNSALGWQAHEAERHIFFQLLMLGLALLKVYFAKRGTGDVGPAIKRPDEALLVREKSPRECHYFSIFGKVRVPRTCYRREGHPGVFPLDEQVNLPEGCHSYFLQEWMTVFEVERPYKESSNLFQQLFGAKVCESVLINVAKQAHQDLDPFYEQRPVPPTAHPEHFLAVGFDGKGVPMIKEEAAKLKAKLGKGEKRQKTKEALVGVCYDVAPKSRTAEELAEYLVNPEEWKKKREESGVDDDSPKAKNIRRIASLVKTKEQVMDTIKADAERRDPEHKRHLVILLDGALGLWRLASTKFKEWKSISLVLDIIHVLSYLWIAANALFPENSFEGRQWVQEKLTEILRGKVGYVIGSLKLILAKRRLSKAKRAAIGKVIKYFKNHRRWMKYDLYLTAGLPVGTGVVESACGSVIKNRMEGTGKRWGIPGAEAILALRSLKKSHDDDLQEYWRFRARKEHERLYGELKNYRPSPVLRLVA